VKANTSRKGIAGQTDSDGFPKELLKIFLSHRNCKERRFTFLRSIKNSHAFGLHFLMHNWNAFLFNRPGMA